MVRHSPGGGLADAPVYQADSVPAASFDVGIDLELGSDDARLLYLVEGELELLAIDGALRRVRHTDTAASGPVSRLRPLTPSGLPAGTRNE